jgi:hypothetical protein
MKVKVNGIADVVLTDRYLKSDRRSVEINKFGNVLVNITVRFDEDGLLDLFALLHIDADIAAADLSKSKTDLSSALDWTVAKLVEKRALVEALVEDFVR